MHSLEKPVHLTIYAFELHDETGISRGNTRPQKHKGQDLDL